LTLAEIHGLVTVFVSSHGFRTYGLFRKFCYDRNTSFPLPMYVAYKRLPASACHALMRQPTKGGFHLKGYEPCAALRPTTSASAPPARALGFILACWVDHAGIPDTTARTSSSVRWTRIDVERWRVYGLLVLVLLRDRPPPTDMEYLSIAKPMFFRPMCCWQHCIHASRRLVISRAPGHRTSSLFNALLRFF